jgi:hypothetical protein
MNFDAWDGGNNPHGERHTRIHIARAIGMQANGSRDRAHEDRQPHAVRYKHNSPNPFELALNGGQMISHVSLEPAQGEDDDWVTFKLGEPRPRNFGVCC